MGLGDSVGIDSVKLVNEVTIPKLKQAATEVIDKLNGLVLNLANGAVITITISIPSKECDASTERKVRPETL
jgi:hypothetical protein